jgi:hypothetical protein
MRTAYKGINRAQAMKRYRELLQHQKIQMEKKRKSFLGKLLDFMKK